MKFMDQAKTNKIQMMTKFKSYYIRTIKEKGINKKPFPR